MKEHLHVTVDSLPEPYFLHEPVQLTVQQDGTYILANDFYGLEFGTGDTVDEAIANWQDALCATLESLSRDYAQLSPRMQAKARRMFVHVDKHIQVP